MESQGALLKKIRLEKGLSLEDVHKRTKIHTDIIKSLEDDAFVNLSPVYRKSFMKIYCQFLGVNPSEVGGEQAQGRPDELARNASSTHETRVFLRKPVPRTRPVMAANTVKIIIAAAAGAILLLGMVSLGRFIGSRLAAGSRNKKAPAVLPVRKPSPRTPLAATPRTAARSPGRTTAAAGTETGIQVSIQALDDVWVQVALDTKVVFQNILKKGRSESWNAKDKVTLTIGSAGGVRLEVNGKVYESLGQKGQVLKDLVITRDGSLVSAAR